MTIRMLLGAALAGLLALAPAANAQDKAPAQPPATQPANPPSAQPQTPPATPPAAPPAAQPDKPATPDKPAEPPKQEEKLVYVTMKTSMGEVVLELNNEKAPISTANFLSYVDKKFYDGTIFHRVIPKFMVQGGGFTADMQQKQTDKPIKNEWQNGLKNTKGSIAMARLGERPDSATSQFFINVADNPFLNEPRDGAGYAVFGKVVGGMDVVEKIKDVPTGVKNRMSDVPVQTVTIESIRRSTPEEVSKIKQ